MMRALAFLLVLLPATALAHDSWINKGGFRSPVSGEWCCGSSDCARMDDDAVSIVGSRYRFNGMATYFGSSVAGNIREKIDELVPDTEMTPSPDGKFWRCKRPDGTRRCVFGPPPGS